MFTEVWTEVQLDKDNLRQRIRPVFAFEWFSSRACHINCENRKNMLMLVYISVTSLLVYKIKFTTPFTLYSSRKKQTQIKNTTFLAAWNAAQSQQRFALLCPPAAGGEMAQLFCSYSSCWFGAVPSTNDVQESASSTGQTGKQKSNLFRR